VSETELDTDRCRDRDRDRAIGCKPYTGKEKKEIRNDNFRKGETNAENLN
jgi:hypothetical protein